MMKYFIFSIREISRRINIRGNINDYKIVLKCIETNNNK